ncbi:CHAT domain-containing protein [Rheinheimera muenzenbergensis]|uniref:CHAT domain-containing protein n=1 Tax=Rheinheimera muenzenbergensis TaxID=1193628 RepID=A0ABU8C9E2_9GAMM
MKHAVFGVLLALFSPWVLSQCLVYGEVSSVDLGKMYSHTLAAEKLLVNKHERLKQCAASDKALMEAQYELGIFWSQFGVESSKAVDYLTEVKHFYAKNIKWNRLKYAKAILGLAESNYLNGRFQISLSLINEFDDLTKQYTDLPNTLKQDAASLLLLLAIALDSIIDIDVSGYNPKSDLSVFYVSLDRKSAHTNNDGLDSDLLYRDELRRLTRWLQYQVFKGNKSINEDAISDLDWWITHKIGRENTDELYLSYALARLPFEKNRCTSSSARFIQEKFRQSQIESQINLIAATALIAQCQNSKVESEQHLANYLQLLDEYYGAMPPQFSIEVLLPIRQSSNDLIENISWPALSNGWDHLVKLIQLKEIGSVARSPARFDADGLGDLNARKAFVEQEQLSNLYFKLSANHYSSENTHLAKVRNQLNALTKRISVEYPKLLSANFKRAVAVKDIKQFLPGNGQIIMFTSTDNTFCGVNITNTQTKGTCNNFSKAKWFERVSALRQSVISNDVDIPQTSANVSAYLALGTLINTTKSEVYLYSQELLNGLPVNVLTEPENKSWLAEKYNVARLLNLSLFTAEYSPNKNKFLRRLAVANPLYNNLLMAKVDYSGLDSLNIAYKQDSRSASNSLLSLSALPETELEAKSFIQNTSHGTLLTAKKATEQNIREKLTENWDIAIFSTHTVFPNSSNQLEYPALALTPESTEELNDGLLLSNDIAAMSINQTWVILAACDTALSIGSRSNLGSLLESFSLAGANSVLASHWKVNSIETVYFMDTLSAMLEKHENASLALWETRRSMLKQYPPRAWSAFDNYF